MQRLLAVITLALLLPACAPPSGSVKEPVAMQRGLDVVRLRTTLDQVHSTLVLLNAAAGVNGATTPESERVVAQVLDLATALSTIAANADLNGDLVLANAEFLVFGATLAMDLSARLAALQTPTPTQANQ